MKSENHSGAFLANYQQGAIFDEVQHVPELLSYSNKVNNKKQKQIKPISSALQFFFSLGVPCAFHIVYMTQQNPHLHESLYRVITGFSGSGKSSLAFDTIYAEFLR
jgi:hypothetical protein